jgi:hypothetical protein
MEVEEELVFWILKLATTTRPVRKYYYVLNMFYADFNTNRLWVETKSLCLDLGATQVTSLSSLIT